MIDREMIDNMKAIMEPIRNKLDEMDLKINNMEYQITSRINTLENKVNGLSNNIMNMDFQNRKEHREIRQDIETILAVLETKDILPKAQ